MPNDIIQEKVVYLLYERKRDKLLYIYCVVKLFLSFIHIKCAFKNPIMKVRLSYFGALM